MKPIDRIKEARGKWHWKLNQRLATILSFQQNQYMLQTNADYRDVPLFCYLKEIQKRMPVYDHPYDLRRVGRDYDGGYLMAFPFSRDKICYSIGISDDVSFDLDMAKENYEVYQYDHTIAALPISNARFHWKKTGLGIEDKGHFLTLKTMITQNGHAYNNGMVLKMDIEGAEWDVIAGLGEELNQFDQIVIELHGLFDTTKWDKITDGLSKLTRYHNMIHIHGNNYTDVRYVADMVFTDAVEVTLLRKENTESTKTRSFPKKLDMPSDPAEQEILLGRWPGNLYED